MNSEKVKEIKKGLECCTNPVYCEKECPYHIYERHLECINELAKDSLTLINELESENEKLGKQCVDWNNLYHKKLDQNQQLKDRIAELEKEKTCVWEEWTDGDHSIWCCSNCKEDFCFIEGDVYENNYGYCPHCGAKITALKEIQEEDIDETLKEFLDAKNSEH